jgi:hypothetical protein
VKVKQDCLGTCEGFSKEAATDLSVAWTPCTECPNRAASSLSVGELRSLIKAVAQEVLRESAT